MSGVLPLTSYGDGKIFDGGTLYVVALVGSAVVLLIAAMTCSSNAAMAGLGGGAAIGVAALLGAFATVIWKFSDGEELGVGTYVMTATAVLGVVVFLVSLGAPTSGTGSTVHWLALAAGFAMSVGCTLVPSDFDGMSWSDYNGFGESGDSLLAFMIQVMIWAPVVTLLIGAVKGGRFGALMGLGGSLVVVWLIVAAKADIVADGFQTIALTSRLHPLAVVGAVAVVVLGLIALSTTNADASPASSFAAVAAATGAGSSPARWADDPFGRHASRYWDGQAWTNQVANSGITSIDPPVAHPAPPPAGTRPAPPAQAASDSEPEFGAPAVIGQLLPPVADEDATVPRSALARTTAVAELILDSGQRVGLVGPLVIGRDPRAQPSVPTATLLAVDDPSMSMSATHMIIGPAPGGAWVEDIGSTNGSSVADPSGAITVLVAGVRTTAFFGSSIHFGDRRALLVSSEAT